jgi:thiol-disulfide isomerase/thioredoxin
VVQTPDSVNNAVDRLIELSRPNAEMFKYMVWFATYHFESSDIMGFDKVFIHIVDKYYVTNQASWADTTVRKNLIKKANRLRPLLIGAVAPNMVMMDTLGRLISLYNLDFNYTIVLFWDPDCGHCEKEIPKLKEYYEKNRERLGLEIFAVCSDSSMVKWKNAIKKKGTTWINVDGPRRLTGNYHDEYDIQSTPTIYILNRKKEIIAKQIRTEEIEQFFKNYKPKS